MSNTILIVDDNEPYGTFLLLLLQRQGFEACHVMSARHALEILATTQFDAVITDIYMPECDGIELLRQLGERHQGLPVLGMTTDEDLLPVLDRVFRYTGGLAVVRKPTDRTELVAMLATLTAVRQLA